jgi:DUF1365 family protein
MRRNTFGEIHPYVLPVKPDEASSAGIQQAQDRLFYVSLFLKWRCATISIFRHRTNISGCAFWRPAARARISPRLSQAATAPPTTRALLGSFVSSSLVTLKIVAAIHWGALRLRIKGAALVPRPNTAAANAHTNVLASGESRVYTDLTLKAREARSGPANED